MNRTATHRLLPGALALLTLTTLLLRCMQPTPRDPASTPPNSSDAVAQPPRPSLATPALSARLVARTPAAQGMPQVLGRAPNPVAYVRWVLDQGGSVILTRGGIPLPIACLDARLHPVDLPTGFRLPAGRLRDASAEVAALFGGRLPRGASRALLRWPPNEEKAFEQALRKQPFFGWANRVEVEYRVTDAKLRIRLRRALVNDEWQALNTDLDL